VCTGLEKLNTDSISGKISTNKAISQRFELSDMYFLQMPFIQQASKSFRELYLWRK
jgi:hypothetical protein